MGRYTFPTFTKSRQPRYIVVWDLQWKILECERVAPAADLSGAMASAIDRLERHGWTAEATPQYGFAFIRGAAGRRLLMLTPRDPYSTTKQSFNPFRE
jgi:hypothetical protein